MESSYFTENIEAFLSNIRFSRNCSLTKLYKNRSEAKKDILRDLRKANADDKIWLSGVALSDVIELDQILHYTIPRNLEKIKIILLDGLRSPAIFRTFLESSPAAVERILDAERDPSPAIDPYFIEDLYNDFESSYKKLKRKCFRYPDFYKCIRYSAHTPTFWLVRIGEKIYFQPYTFGRTYKFDQKNIDPSPDELKIGAFMPVFKFEIQDSPNVFDIIADHFTVLWQTSDTDLFHEEARIADNKRIIEKIFRTRKAWFEHIRGVLCDDASYRNIDKRVYPRQDCIKSPDSIKICWTHDNRPYDQDIIVKNCSFEGFGLQIKGDSTPKINDKVSIKVNYNSEPITVKHLIDSVLERSNNQFNVRWVSNKKPRELGIVLQKNQ